MKTLPAIAIIAVLSPMSSISAADPVHADGAPDPVHVDAEVDPTAYVLEGYSLHLGVGYRHLRVDLGAFALALPQFVHGDDGFDVSFHGFGAKLQYFLDEEQRGFFAGVDGALDRMLVARQGTDLAVTQTQGSLGVHAGFRIPVVGDFYATPWLGVGWAVGAHDVTLGGATYKAHPLLVFPAIHLGYQFQ